jgi:histidinol-phosphate aminotransferase
MKMPGNFGCVDLALLNETNERPFPPERPEPGRPIPAEAVNLALNESPYEIPEALWEKLALAIHSTNRYPIDGEAPVIRKIAARFGIAESMVMLTQGIDEAVDRLIQQSSHLRFVVFTPGFDGYAARLEANHQHYRVIRLDESFNIRPRDLARLGRKDFVILANPGNPTGNLVSRETLAALADRCGGLLIDETYVDFSRHDHELKRIREHVFVFRSFSKSYALAGLRIGFLAGAPDAIRAMRSRQWFCNMNLFSLAAVDAALDHDYNRTAAARILAEKEKMVSAAESLGFRVIRTAANFFLIEDRSGLLLEHLGQKNILVRDTSRFGLEGYLRVTAGSPESSRALINALREFQHSRKGFTHERTDHIPVGAEQVA